MPQSPSKVIHIAQPTGKATLSKGQKQFNRLIAKIETNRRRLADWQHAMPQLKQSHDELVSLTEKFCAERRKLVLLLDRMHGDKALTKPERKKLSDLIGHIALSVLQDSDGEEEEVKSIYNAHSGADYDADKESERQMVKDQMMRAMGIDLSDEDMELRSPLDIFARIDELMRAKMEQEQKSDEGQDGRPAQEGGPRQGGGPGWEGQEGQEGQEGARKSAKTLAKEARLKADVDSVRQSVREVYRKLASALHPDREQDPDERARKTDLMQKVNVAYDKGDLLRLLELQLEIEQIDQSMVNSLSEERVKHFNKVLKEQVDELEMEIRFAAENFRMRFNRMDSYAMTPVQARRELKLDIDELSALYGSLRHDQECFKDVRGLKAELKAYRINRQSADDDMFAINSVFGGFSGGRRDDFPF